MHHDWEVRLYYLNGELALHTWNVDAVSKDMEVAAGRAREDIGRIEVLEVGVSDWKPALT